jgi:hypothetical protein
MEIANSSQAQCNSSFPPTLPVVAPHDWEGSLRCTAASVDSAWLSWLQESQMNGFYLYKVDVTFSSSGAAAAPQRWLEYFDRRVAYKIKKALGFRPRKDNARTSYPCPVTTEAREYEFDIKSHSYHGADWRCPHHIHSIVRVPEEVAPRMTSRRMKTDLMSLKEVSSVHIERIPSNNSDPGKTLLRAYYYMRKGKTSRPLA